MTDEEIREAIRAEIAPFLELDVGDVRPDVANYDFKCTFRRALEETFLKACTPMYSRQWIEEMIP